MDDRYRQYFEEMPCYLSVHDTQFRIIDGPSIGEFERIVTTGPLAGLLDFNRLENR